MAKARKTKKVTAYRAKFAAAAKSCSSKNKARKGKFQACMKAKLKKKGKR